MSTLYEWQVLEVAPAEPRLRVRVWVFGVQIADPWEDWMADRPLPGDRAFFLSLLLERAFDQGSPGSLRAAGFDGAPADELPDVDWVNAHAARFVERIACLASWPNEASLEPRSGLAPARAPGEAPGSMRIQAVYDVWVTSPRLLDGLSVGQVHDSAACDGDAVVASPEELLALPFPPGNHTRDWSRIRRVPLPEAPDLLAGSPDGRWVAVTCAGGEVVVAPALADGEPWTFPHAAGELLTWMSPSVLEQLGGPAWDVAARAPVEPSGDLWLARSASGRRGFRLLPDFRVALEADGETIATFDEGRIDEQRLGFSRDESLAWWCRGGQLEALDLASGARRALPLPAGARPALSPDGRWVALARSGEVSLLRFDGGAKLFTRELSQPLVPGHDGRRLQAVRGATWVGSSLAVTVAFEGGSSGGPPGAELWLIRPER